MTKEEIIKILDSTNLPELEKQRLTDELFRKQESDKLGLLSHVLPEDSVLFKPNHGLFWFYKCYEDFEDEKEYTMQGSFERFEDFIKRTINKLQEDEAERGDQYPIVTIDNAIYSNGV